MTMQGNDSADGGDIVPVRVDKVVWKCSECGAEYNTEQECLEHVERCHRVEMAELLSLSVHRTAGRSRFDGPRQVRLYATMHRPRGVEVELEEGEDEDELCYVKASYLVPASKRRLEAVRARARRVLVEAVEARARRLETLCADVRRRFKLDKEEKQ